MEIYQQAHNAEQAGNWLEAERLWRSINRKLDADACRMIIDANARGDEYRRRIGPEPDKWFSAHDWVKWFDNMSNIYNEMFKLKT